nr:biotin/lipoyl-binding protein [Neobacillus sp. Marseille-Q6967]
MQAIEEAIYSPCAGTVEQVLTKENNHVYEWEKLFLIRTSNGRIEEISIGISGYIKSLSVKKGQMVNANTLLATIEDDLIITGSD